MTNQFERADKVDELRRAALYLGPLILGAVLSDIGYRAMCTSVGFSWDVALGLGQIDGAIGIGLRLAFASLLTAYGARRASARMLAVAGAAFIAMFVLNWAGRYYGVVVLGGRSVLSPRTFCSMPALNSGRLV